MIDMADDDQFELLALVDCSMTFFFIISFLNCYAYDRRTCIGATIFVMAIKPSLSTTAHCRMNWMVECSHS